MHERAGYVSGELSLESGPGRGTRVRVVIPMEPGSAAGARPYEPLEGMVDRLMEGMVSPEEDVGSATPGRDKERLTL
jgi:hypothetical protein